MASCSIVESEHGGFMIALSQRMKRVAKQVGLVFQGADPPIVGIAFPRVEPERRDDRKTTMISGDLSVCPKAVIRGRPCWRGKRTFAFAAFPSVDEKDWGQRHCDNAEGTEAVVRNHRSKEHARS